MIDGLRILSLLVVAGLFIRALIKEKKLPSPPTWVLGFLEAWICLITFLNDGDLLQVCSLAVSVMGMTLLVDLFADKPQQLLGALMLNFEWSVYANLYTVLKWPKGGFIFDYEYNQYVYFFGSDNWFMYLCIPAVCVALLFLRAEWKRNSSLHRVLGVLRAAALIAASYASVYTTWPATAVMALAVFAVVMLLLLIPGVHRLVSYPVVLIGGIAANLAIAVVRVMETVPAIANLIQNQLKKDITLSGRTDIWDTFPSLIDGHLWTGIGALQGGYPVGEDFFDHMHNAIFDILIQGGIPALILFAAVLVLVGIPLTRHAKTLSARIVTAAMAALLIMCIPEVCRHHLIYLLFPLAWHVGSFEESLHRLPAEGTEA